MQTVQASTHFVGSNMPEKRSALDDDAGADHKRSRSNTGSPAPAHDGGIAPKTDIQAQIAAAKARAAAVRARLDGNKASSPAGGAAATPASAAARAKIEAMKARVAAATARAAPPAASPITHTQSPVSLSELKDGMSKARGGLGIGLHPALMGDTAPDARNRNRNGMGPKFATTMANRRNELSASAQKGGRKQLDLSGPSVDEIKKNPYFDPNIGSTNVVGPKDRRSRQLSFNQKGKFIAQANAIRRQAQLEAMKRRIAESARKAGLDDEGEKAFLIQEPPDVEWWDEGLISTKSYDPSLKNLKLEGEDTIVTRYIQHPVLLQPPQEKNAPPPKPMYLTKTEQAKLRRQRRNAEHKEQQAKIRLGLEPPPPPKVKKSNLMRVLGEEAVKDPTAVEARVNREIAERKDKHLATNEERKLTKEQRHDKVATQQERDEAKGIYCSVYKINNLSYGQHRYKIDVNAKQLGLTGITILNPKMNLVIVEGGEHGVNKYRKLMLNRIVWTENAGTQGDREKAREEADWLKAEDEQGRLKDLSLNRCLLVWEGQLGRKAFRKWGSRVCETEADARECLQRSKMDSFWTLAKSMD